LSAAAWTGFQPVCRKDVAVGRSGVTANGRTADRLEACPTRDGSRRRHERRDITTPRAGPKERPPMRLLYLIAVTLVLLTPPRRHHLLDEHFTDNAAAGAVCDRMGQAVAEIGGGAPVAPDSGGGRPPTSPQAHAPRRTPTHVSFTVRAVDGHFWSHKALFELLDRATCSGGGLRLRALRPARHPCAAQLPALQLAHPAASDLTGELRLQLQPPRAQGQGSLPRWMRPWCAGCGSPSRTCGWHAGADRLKITAGPELPAIGVRKEPLAR